MPLVLVATMISVCFAADIAGKWVGSVDTADGLIPITYKFTVEGESLKGTAEAMSQTMAIENGRVTEDSVFFEVDYNGMPVIHSGSIQGDSIRMVLELGEDIMEGVFVKQK
ncbi:MAG TPA: hypothetical protein VGE15_12275 [Sphingobacteriaceae bacterium]